MNIILISLLACASGILWFRGLLMSDPRSTKMGIGVLIISIFSAIAVESGAGTTVTILGWFCVMLGFFTLAEQLIVSRIRRLKKNKIVISGLILIFTGVMILLIA